MIDQFRGKWFFLSNFYPCEIIFNGYTFKNAEAAFQAQKDPARAKEFINLQPNAAKRKGRHVNLRSDWNEVKLSIMESIIRAKFNQNKDLAQLLLTTQNKKLIEGNNWGDIFWGVCNGKGENFLGNILMKIRNEINTQSL